MNDWMVGGRVNRFESWIFHLHSVTFGKSVSLTEPQLLTSGGNGQCSAAQHSAPGLSFPPKSTSFSPVGPAPSSTSCAWHKIQHAVGAQYLVCWKDQHPES